MPAPVLIVEQKEGVVIVLVAACGIGEGRALPAAIHTPHPELHSNCGGWKVFEIAVHQHLQA